jgi:hypothetical protein
LLRQPPVSHAEPRRAAPRRSARRRRHRRAFLSFSDRSPRARFSLSLSFATCNQPRSFSLSSGLSHAPSSTTDDAATAPRCCSPRLRALRRSAQASAEHVRLSLTLRDGARETE